MVQRCWRARGERAQAVSQVADRAEADRHSDLEARPAFRDLYFKSSCIGNGELIMNVVSYASHTTDLFLLILDPPDVLVYDLISDLRY